MDDNDRRRRVVLLRECHRRHGFPLGTLWRLRLRLRFFEELLRCSAHLLRSGCPDLCRSDVRCPDLRCSDGFRLQLV